MQKEREREREREKIFKFLFMIAYTDLRQLSQLKIIVRENLQLWQEKLLSWTTVEEKTKGEQPSINIWGPVLINVQGN